jgi:hypothetical protein
VEDAAGALDRRLNGSRVEKVHLKQPEPRVRVVQGQQVLRLPLVLCENDDWSRCLLRLNPMKEFVQRHTEEERITEVLDGGVYGVSTVEEDTD